MGSSPNAIKFAAVSTATTTSVANAEELSHIVINGGTLTGAITIYDAESATGTPLATIAGGAGQLQGQNYPYVCHLETGLTVVTAEAVDITILYRLGKNV